MGGCEVENFYKVSLNLEESSFSVESTDREWTEQKQKELTQFVLSHQTTYDESSSEDQHRKTTIPAENITIQEYYKKYIQPISKTSRPDLAVLLVYFLERVKGQTEIKTGDIASAFANIGYPNYNKINFSDVLYNSRKKGFLNNVNNNWTLTITGEDFAVDRISSQK
jgi:hypothetical protein